MFVHVFGAYFGLTVATVLSRDGTEKAAGKEGSVYHSDLFSVVGRSIAIGSVYSIHVWNEINCTHFQNRNICSSVMKRYMCLMIDNMYMCSKIRSNQLRTDHVLLISCR